jgi:hypothetical protein
MIERLMTAETYFQICISQTLKLLGNFEKWFDKLQAHAETKKFDVTTVINARLAPDQYNLIRQVQITSDTAKLSASRLTGKEAPAFEDNEQTLDELRTRIKKTIAYLQTYKVADFQNIDSRKISLPWMKDKFFLASEYFVTFAIPNFYFHYTTSYAILRHNGVDVGKKDYLGELPLQNV